MLQLRRVRLENVGHRAAGFKSLVLDLTGGPASIDGRPARPVDVILWLRNGGGKSTLLSLFFSLLLPAKKDFIGALTAKSLAEYIPGGQVSHVIAEWGDSERPASGAVLVTGGVYQWRDGQRPADPGSGWERLERRWYLLRPQPGGLEMDRLPVRAEGLQLSMNSYVKALEAAYKLERRLQLVVAQEQYAWEEQLGHHGLDPQVFVIQKVMNQEEGGITELFKFRTAEEFIDFLIDMIVDAAAPTAARAALSKHADKLAARPAREMEERLLAEAVLRLRPVQKATAEAALAEQELGRQAQLARRAGEHIQAQAERREHESGSLRERAEGHAREAQEADERVEGRRHRVAAVREAAARLRVSDCASAHARRLEAADAAGQDLAAWRAVPLLIDLADREAERLQVSQLLGDLYSEQAPLREAVEQAGAALYTRLEDGLARLADEEDQARAQFETAGAEVQAAEREFEKAVGSAGHADSRAASAEARRAEGEEDIAAARRSGLLGPREEPQAALERLTLEEEVAREHVEQARRQREAAQERAAGMAAERMSCAGRLSTAKQHHDHVWEQWNTLARERRDLAAEPRLGELAGTGGGPGELDLDVAGSDLIAMLADEAARADRELAAEHGQASEDQRLRNALEQDGFCPPPREVEQAVAALRERGANALAGMQFLRETVPTHRHDEVIAAIPQLIGGVVICGPVPGGDLAALARQTGVSLPTVIAVGSDQEARSLLSREPGEQADVAVLPIRPSVLDLEASEEELRRVAARLDTLEERLKVVTARREADTALAGRLRDHLVAFGPQARTALEELLSRLDDEVTTLTEHTTALAHKAQEAAQSEHQAEQQFALHTHALMALAQTLPQVRSLEAVARATVRWVEEGRQARIEAREHRAAAQQLKKRCENAQERRRTAEAALRQCRERGERWAGWVEEIRQELPDEVISRARPAAVPAESLQALRERWGQARRDWLDGISDTTLQQRLAAAQSAIDTLSQKLADTTGSAVRARAVELARQAEAADTDRLTDRIAVADAAHKNAERAEHEADLLHRQALEAHHKAAEQLDELAPGAQQVSFSGLQAAQEELQAEEHRLEEDRALAQVRRLDAERTHRAADLAAAQAAQLRQSAGSLSTATDRQPPGHSDDSPELSVDALLLERHGLSAVAARSLQPQDAERIKDAITGEILQAARAHDGARTALRKSMQQVERLSLQPEYAAVVDGRLRERLQQDLALPARLTALLEDIEEREREVRALLAESDEDHARVVDACASTVEAVLDSVEEAARHSRLPGNLGSWSAQRFLTLELRQRARGDELARPAVHHFSMLPLASDYPRRPSWQRRDDPVVVDPTRIPAFAESLPESVRPVLSTPAAVEQLLTGWKARQVLDQDQYALLQDCRVPPAVDERLAEAQVDAEWATRWVLARVASLGWSPELFAEFDNSRGRMSGSRQSHKGERIGKKYQWMALHELVERLANHRHPHRTSEHDAAEYPGAAQLLLLDIDPSLPPARHPFAGADDESGSNEADNATFAPADPSHPLAPPVPALPDADGIDEWISHPGNLPDLDELGVRTDGQGREWVVLHEQATDDHDGRGWSATHGQAEQWHRVHSWIVSDDQFTSLLTWLEGRALTHRMMPDGPDRHSLLFADFPTVPGPWTDPEPDSWHVSTFQHEEHEPAQDAPDTSDDDDDLASPETAPGPAADAETVDALAMWRKKREKRQAESLVELAKQWADSPVDDKDDWLERTLAAQPQGRIDRATDTAGQPVTAIPTDQTYNWSAQSSDCSLDAPVSVTLLNDPLLRDSGLRRDPDRPYWYDADGHLQVQYLTWDRPSGTAHSLLASREWLEQQLQRIGHCLVQGMLGERQTVAAEHPFTWREFSQSAGHTARGRRTSGTTVTALRKSLR